MVSYFAKFLEFSILLFLAIIAIIGFTGGFSTTIGALKIQAHGLKNPVIFLISSLLIRRVLVGAFFQGCFWLTAVQRVSDKFARRCLTSRRFRRSLMLPLGMMLAFVLNPLQYGLKATYYDNQEWRGDPILTTTERPINLWRMQSDFPFITEKYSIQWRGVIFIPATGEYQFAAISDDRSEIALDDRTIIENKILEEVTGNVYLERGFHALTIRYMQNRDEAGMRVFWTPPGQLRTELEQASLFAEQPTETAFLLGKCLHIMFLISAWLCVFGVIGGVMLLLISHAILAPFLGASPIGRAYQRCREAIYLEPVYRPAMSVSSHNNLTVMLLAFAGYVLLTCAWTYPLIRDFSSKMVGYGGDRYIGLWNMWWMKKSLLELHVNPLFTDYLFYPHGISLAFHDYSIFNAFISVPLQAIFSLPEIYNICFLATYILGGFGAFLLIRYLTGDALAAFISGIVFAFWGGRAYYTDHLSLFSVQWFPYCALYLIKTLRENSYRNPIFAALFLVMNALTSWYYGIYMSLFAALFLAYSACAERKIFFTRRCLKRFGLIGLLFTILILPCAYPMFKDLAAGQNYMQSASFTEESAHLNTLLLPNVNHGVLGKYMRYWHLQANLPMKWGLVGGSFLGYVVLLLCVYAGVRLRQKSARFWLIATLVFLLFAMGPHPLAFSQEYRSIPLPYLLLQQIPVLKIARVPMRFMVMTMFCVSGLVGYACADIFRRIRPKKLAFAVLTAAILFEAYRAIGVSAIETPPAFYKQLAQDHEPYAILELTKLMNWEHSAARSSLFQIAHEKKVFHGHVSRVSFDTYRQAYAMYTVFDDLLTIPPKYLAQAAGQILSLGDDQNAIAAMLSFYNVRYVTLYSDYWYGKSYEENRARLQRIFGEPVSEENGMCLFKVKPVQASTNIAFPGLGMFPLMYEDDVAVRHITRSADMKILNVNQAQNVQMQFQARSDLFPKEERVQILVNDSLIMTAAVNDWTPVTIPAAALAPGENTIEFHMITEHSENWKQGMFLRNLEVKVF